MKLRTGFVSNSSSASYVVTIKISMEEFVELIYEHFDFEFFNISSLIKELKEDIDTFIKDREECDPKFRNAFYTEDRLNNLKKELQQLEEVKGIENEFHPNGDEGQFVYNKVYVVKLLLDMVYKVHMNEKQPGVLELTAWTAMHNSMADLPEVLKSIVAFLDFKHATIPKTCEVKKDN